MNFEDIRGRCREDGDCLLWAGATSKGHARIWAPDFTTADGEKRSQSGKRAVWHVVTGKPIPNGWRVFGTCGNTLCMNPKHIACRHPAEQGKLVAESGQQRGSMKRLIANRASGRARSTLSPELIQALNQSSKSGIELAREYGISQQLVSSVRTGKAGLAFQPVGGMFTGLMRP